MIAMLTLEVIDLPPTRTYAARTAVWVSNGSGEVDMPGGEVVPGLGKLTIRLRKGRAWDCTVEQDTYAVQEVEPEEFGSRLFLLLNLTDRTAREPYRVTVGGRNLCRCKAGRCRVPADDGSTAGCKHRDALAALIEAGFLEPVAC